MFYPLPGGQTRRLFCPLSFIFFLLFVFLTQAFAQINQYYLLLEDERGQVLLSVQLAEGEKFAISYRHSVALTPVTDFFKIRNGEIWLDSTVYSDFGAGLPHNPEAGQKMTHANGVLTISGYERRLPVFQLRVGRVANHVLQLFGNKKSLSGEPLQEIPLDSLAEAGRVITFSLASQKPE